MWTINRDKSGVNKLSRSHPSLDWEYFLKEDAPQAICLHGPEEGNLLHYGIELAARMLCTDHSACGLCRGCKALEKVDSTRFIPLFPSSQVISIEAVRELIQSQKYQLDKGDRQVFLILYPSQLNKEAANALLKNLEEPSTGRIFILINPFSSMLMPTISSRLSHIYLPGFQSADETGDARSQTLGRLCDFDVYSQTEDIAEIIMNPKGPGAYFREWAERIKNSNFSVENLLYEQLRCGLHRARRKIAVCSFVEELGIHEYRFLDSELDALEAGWKALESVIRARLITLRDSREEELGRTYKHWLLKDFKNQGQEKRVDQFLNGIITRELERILREICVLFDVRDLHTQTTLLKMEQQIRKNYSSLFTPHGLYDLQAELSSLFQMMRSNIGWKDIIEQCGFLLLRFREGRIPLTKFL